MDYFPTCFKVNGQNIFLEGWKPLTCHWKKSCTLEKENLTCGHETALLCQQHPNFRLVFSFSTPELQRNLLPGLRLGKFQAGELFTSVFLAHFKWFCSRTDTGRVNALGRGRQDPAACPGLSQDRNHLVSADVCWGTEDCKKHCKQTLSSSLAEAASAGQSCSCFPIAALDPVTGALQLANNRMNSFLIQPLISMSSKGKLSEI